MHPGFEEYSDSQDNTETSKVPIEQYFTQSQVNTNILIKKNNVKNPLSLTDSDYSLGELNKPFIPHQIRMVISPELLVINYSLLKNFPKFIKPIMYAWHDSTEENQQTFNATLLKYFKKIYSKIASNMVFISLSYSRNVQMETISKLRTDFSTGRIIFHHIGYGFPQLTSDYIYLSENVRISTKLLFISLTPPTLYIFDCDNAGSILQVFENIAVSRSVQNWKEDANSQKKPNERNFSPFQCLSNSVDWSDYFCFCATSKGEELPRDPNLPRDFFTSVLYSPIQTAFLCQLYLSYRTTIAFSDIHESIVSELEQLLDVIVDGIVSECLPWESVQLFFHSDKVMRMLFRNFVLAQYVLKPFGVHPVSRPPLPDMSSNQLWEQWKAGLDNSIGLFAKSRSPTKDYFDRALTSFNYLYSNYGYNGISPSLLTALFRSENYEGPARLVVEFPDSRKVIANIVVMKDLFENLMKLDPSSSKFNDICIVIIYMLKFDMNFCYQIPNEFNWNLLLNAIFDENLKMSIRLLVISIVSTCVPYNKSLRYYCTTRGFVQKIQKKICSNDQNLALIKWLFILFKRTYDVVSANPKVFEPSGFHIQCSLCAFHYSPDIRASSISCLSSFLQGDDPQLNLRLLLFALPSFNDISYLVRHQLLMLILRYLTAHQDEIVSNQQLNTFNITSFESLSSTVFCLPEINLSDCSNTIVDFFNAVEAETMNNLDLSSNLFTPQRINDLLQFVISFFAYDPHPSIAAEAATAREFFFRKGKKSEHSTIVDMNEEEEYSENDSLMCIQFESDSDALYQICLRQTLDSVSKKDEISFQTTFASDNWSKQSGPSLKVECQMNHRPSAICFDSLSTGVIVACDNNITYYDDNLNASSSIHIGSSFITDLKSGSWFGKSFPIVSCGNGCVYIFRFGDENNKKPICCFRADTNIMAASIPLYCSPANDRPKLATVRGKNHAVLWDMETLRIVQDIPPDANLSILSTMNQAQAIPLNDSFSPPLSPSVSSSSSSSSLSPFITSAHSEFDALSASSQPLFQSTLATSHVGLSSQLPEATSIALHPSNPNLLMTGYENGYVVITDLRGNVTVESLCLSNSMSPVVKVSGNVDGNSTFYAVAKNGSCLKWSPSPSPFINFSKRKFSMPLIRTGMSSSESVLQESTRPPLSASEEVNETSNLNLAPKPAPNPNSRRVSLFSPQLVKPASSDISNQTNMKSNITTMNGVEIHDFAAHQILPILAFAPEALSDQIIMNEATGKIQKVKMDAGSNCVFHPTQPMCALASGRKLKIFRL